MKRALLIGVATCAVGLAATAVPALSLRPYQPKPVDFSMKAPADAVLGDPGLRSGGVVSQPLRAPERFNLVGLKWASEGEPHGDPALAMRTRADGGEWTHWEPITAHSEDGPDPGTAEAAASGMANPVWAGEADWVQYRSSEELHDLRLHFVNVKGTATGADRLRTAVGEAASTAVASVAGLFGADGSDAAEPKPAIVPRSEWAGSSCNPRSAPDYGQVKAAYIHHTVNPNDYSADEAASIVLGICRYHRNTNGWNDVGYNFLVDRFGTVYEGRAGGVGAAVIGAQAEGFNAQSTGIANIGTFSNVEQTDAALEAIAGLIRWKLPLHGYPTNGTAVLQSAGGGSNRYPSGATVRVQRVLGHQDTNATECPGTALHAQLPDLRRRIGGLAPQGTATSLTAAVDARRSTIDYGDEVTVAGTLKNAAGAPVAGQPVLVQARVEGGWRTSSTQVTAADGSFVATVKPRQTLPLRVRFAGAGDLRSSVGPTIALKVRTDVTIGAVARRAKVGKRVIARGRVRPRVGRIQQVLRVRHRGRWRLAGVKWVKVGERGWFRGSFVPSARGVYRVYFVAGATAARARGSSEKADVGVGVAPPVVDGGALLR